MKNLIEADKLDKGQRKDVIVENYKLLSVGESIILKIGLDPIPLRVLFENTFKGKFEWNYIKKGPELWEIEIKKISKKDYYVNELLNEYPSSKYIFEHYKVDYFTQGDQLLSKCLPANVPLSSLLDEIFNLNKRNYNCYMPRYYDWPLSFLTRYIVINHHSYVKKKLPELQSLLDSIVTMHGDEQPEIMLLRDRFKEFCIDLSEHLDEEESMVFPTINQLETDHHQDDSKIDDAITWMKEDHILVKGCLETFRSLGNQYIVRNNTYPAYKVLSGVMKKFELDFHIHIHLENNILFPKALQLLK